MTIYDGHPIYTDPRLSETIKFWLDVAQEQGYTTYIQTDVSHWMMEYIEDGIIDVKSYHVDGLHIYALIRPSFDTLVRMYFNLKAQI
jgi:hypothetical protein